MGGVASLISHNGFNAAHIVEGTAGVVSTPPLAPAGHLARCDATTQAGTHPDPIECDEPGNERSGQHERGHQHQVTNPTNEGTREGRRHTDSEGTRPQGGMTPTTPRSPAGKEDTSPVGVCSNYAIFKIWRRSHVLSKKRGQKNAPPNLLISKKWPFFQD